MPENGHAFLDTSRAYLRDDYLPKIARCVEALSPDDVWWRPNDASNSIGNLMLHLAGNVRQWIIHGIGGATDVRKRQHEFDERSPIPPKELLNYLRTTLAEVDAVLASVSPDDLLDKRSIQGLDRTVLEAIYHVVEHFGMHTGQIIYIAKLRTGADLNFWDIGADGSAQKNW